MTKTKFLEVYEKELKARLAWTKNEELLTAYMNTVRKTIMGATGRSSLWKCEGEAVTAAWNAIGGVGTPTIINIRRLRVN